MKRFLLLMACAGLLPACLPGPESAMGFRLPEGDADRGLQAFHDLDCHRCHLVRGMDMPAADSDLEPVVLGRDVGRVQTYGELVTSLINPTHKLAPGYDKADVTVGGESRMALAYLNEVMTVQQLIDLVAFLQPRYEVRPPQYDPYMYSYPSLGK
jgi:L-cysteine S-thiosulfotransferase